MNSYRKEQTAKRIDYTFFSMLTVGMFVVMFFLTYKQATLVGTGVYHSDILAYMKEVLGEESGYPFPYRLFFWLVRLVSLLMPVESAMALVVAGLNALSMVLVKYYFDLYEDVSFHEGRVLLRRLSLSALILGIFVSSMLINPLRMSLKGGEQYYLGVFTGNPWHNQTYLATRPFAILAFFVFIFILKNYEYRANVKDYVVFSISLLLTTMTKPSFTFVFISAAGIYMLVRLCMNSFETFKETVLLGLAFVPTFIELIRQYFGVFAPTMPGEEKGITLTFFEVWSHECTNIPRAILYANLFSIVVLIIFIKEILDDIPYLFTVMLFFVSLFEAAFLAEKGYRFYDFNFSWGYMHGIFFLTLMSAEKLYRAAVREETEKYKIVIGFLSFIPQVLSGIFYLIRILGGAMYY
ncbi:MAG: hypothetical protein J6U37_01650 [Lachnospiraceae bacterium]|nr:hypothetical protein [Lachnospiraceae bacterium]